MNEPGHTRRTAMKRVGAIAATAGIAGTAGAQGDDGDGTHHDDGHHNEHHGSDGSETDGSGTAGDGDRLSIILAGRTEYWYGIAPAEIEGEENPPLNLEAGREYELVWINVDGAEHELIVESADGEELEESDSSETAGEAVSMTFEASEDAAEYYCEYHPETMRGDVVFEGGFDLSMDD
ncbi:cupredoxin domain-containing protein [Halopiger djelfimassiliensis]|uniref:cupredoxin domain-containing protein n=1 Tax=Halopiger djelfimassiliensis TaxID=1293047 RepID=UPI000677819E|nr:plastocyanin/azurin family copper-binding protein [Halopiger djelfimassiliensis]